MTDRAYDTQIVRFGNRGINLSVPPELVGPDQYVRFDEVVTNRDGTIQSAAGGVTQFSATSPHSIRRFVRYSDGTTFFVVGGNNSVYGRALGFASNIEIGTMGVGPYTMVQYKTALSTEPYMFVASATRWIKVDANGTASLVGIIRPLPVYAQSAVIPTSAGAGVLDGDYDWRYTYANSITGAESNPSDVRTPQLTLTNQNANVPVVVSNVAQGSINQIRLYRRGGSFPDEWRLITVLANATQTYVDLTADADLASAEVMDLDNDVPITSVSSSGVTLEDLAAIKLPYLWGVIEETLFATGDLNRPDAVYFSKKGSPESWPAENYLLLDTTNDICMNGFVFGGQSFVFTREALYGLLPNIIEGRTWTPIKTYAGRGVVGPFAFCVGPRVWFCSKDGVYEWAGEGEAERISDAIRPLFPYKGQSGYTVGNYQPIDFGYGPAPIKTIRMTYHNGEVWLHYVDTSGNRQTIIYSVEQKAWRFGAVNTYQFSYSDEIPQSSLIVVDLAGNFIQSQGGALDGVPVASVAMTGGMDQGSPRADKEYGDCAVWADCDGGTILVSVFANSNFAATVGSAVLTGSGLQRYIIPLNGIYARHVAFQFAWDTTNSIQPILYWIETAFIAHPVEITTRMTDWDDLGYPADKLVKGVLLTADTMNHPITLQVVYDDGTVGATFTIGPDASQKPRVYNIGWPSFRGRKVRIVPTSSGEWKFYGVNKWLFDAEPESIGFHEVYWGDAGYAHDKLIKGLTIEADCVGVTRTLRVYDDANVLQQTITIGPGVAGVPALYERSWASFRSRNVRIVELAASASWKLVRIAWMFDPEPPDLIHWESQESNHGFDGFHVERDAYVEYRGGAVLALTVEIDGVVQPAYALPSTASARTRAYLPFRATKGKLYRYRLDSADAFHLYELAIRAHGWDGDAYTQVKPMTASESPWQVDGVRGAASGVI